MVGVVAGALLVAGFGSLLLIRAQARRDTVRDLRAQAQGVAELVDDAGLARNAPNAALRSPALRRILKLTDQEIVKRGADGRPVGALPGGISLDDGDIQQLNAGQTISGVRGTLAYAVAPGQTARSVPFALVLTRSVRTGGGAALWLLLASGAALLVAAVVAANLGRRLTRPLREAEEATRRIAGGDLAVRVPARGEDSELESLIDSINAMAASLERSRGLERQFLLSVSHDLRTPLTSIRGYAEAIVEKKARPPQAASVILSESRRLERLVGDLLELAKLDARSFSFDVRAIDVGEVVADTAEGFRPAAEDAEVALEVDAARDTGLVADADPDRLAQVVANLIENALKFARSSIALTVERASAGVQISVVDDGPGVDAAEADHVFDRFYTGTRRPMRQVGSGLGLAIVHELVTAMGGSVTFEPVANGARIVVALAANESSSSGTSRSGATTPVGTRQAPAPTRRRTPAD
jgi:two-component system sensor histidine kinase BaeS